ncbi:UPF0182 family protein [Sinanaerobacter chloroacetimidivorans]|uniref:UPF0182 protein KCX82_08090 n=1 Tax=Sinanaerobacter chloroacetimidivorans TaxID=2818044 RepID=A0A8J7W295_9FIRM|nr:UPF0182 family protein [Sinanaerobacter chloroacetimidivorans]MBR0597828.1 UPF0182 family protein [Sinanaerobacter chloroacetimidivorans]
MEKKKLGLGIIIAILLILIAGFSGLVSFIADYLWFKELGYTSVFFKQLFTQLQIGIPSFVVITLLTYFYLRVLKRGYYKKIDTVDSPAVSEKTLNRISLGLSAVFGILVTVTTVTSLWFQILKFGNSTSFGIADPIFNLDVSFYVFRLEFIKQLNGIVIGIVIAFGVLTLLYYFLLLSMRRPKIFERDTQGQTDYADPNDGQRFNGNYNNPFSGVFGGAFDKFGQNFNPGGFNQRPKKQFNDDNFKQLISIASKQLIILGVIFFLMVGANFYLRQYELLYSHTGVLYGAGFTDINVTLWVYRAMVVFSVLAAIGFAMGIGKRSYKMVLTVPIIMIILGAAGTGASLLVQNLVVSPDEINKESQYLRNNIVFTQSAYDLQDVTVKPFPAYNNLTSEDIQNNMDTITNIRINDYEPAKKFYNQTQSIRLYYLFNDVDVDRYMINGDYTQTFLSAREIDETQIREEWLNRHLKYTHGYGITLSRVDKVTASGQPDMLIHSIPPVSNVDEIKLNRPEIYFGELTNNYILTNTDEQEFDYPSGDSNIYSTYEGSAGIKLNLFNRVVFAIREQSLKLLVSTNIDSDSRIIINRNIMQRVQKIMPFLQYDSDPYIVTADGKLYWIIDAYTTSSYYPYSEPFAPENSDVNYIRNSVKVVIDAYNGDVSYYLVNDKDPVANTYAKIYPVLFKNFDQMPESLKSHIRYPNVLFNIQANVYKRYHMNDVKVFYQGEDLWAISNEIFGTEEISMTPNYYIMKLPGEEKVEFLNSIPYTPRGKKNMTGLLMARNDGENYGELILYQFPKDKIVYGPMQIESQIDQHTEISKEFSLWNSAGSTYIRGNMFVIPIEESLVYVEPVYLEASNTGSLPEVKRVIVAYGDRIAYEPTLSAALDSLFGEGASGAQPPDNTGAPGNGALSVEELIRLANEAFDNANAAQRNGDWSAYGQYLKQLENYLNQLAPRESQGTDQAGGQTEDQQADDTGTSDL